MKRERSGRRRLPGKDGFRADQITTVEMGHTPHCEASTDGSWPTSVPFHLTRPRLVRSDQAADDGHATGTYWDVLGFAMKLFDLVLVKTHISVIRYIKELQKRGKGRYHAHSLFGRERSRYHYERNKMRRQEEVEGVCGNTGFPPPLPPTWRECLAVGVHAL
ncbi:hypothetical protein LZ31DRAFT_69945 [Colletotrichum somersetense]|nr:hypothetical protein LZ31DRAFT_69945 [Colletotrichum somersetense]